MTAGAAAAVTGDADLPAVRAIVGSVLGHDAAARVLAVVDLAPGGAAPGTGRDDDPAVPSAAPAAPAAAHRVVVRADIALALQVVLLSDLLPVVPSAAGYVDDARAVGRRVVLDHAAVRTVAWPAGALPAGREQVVRLLEPLGYTRHATYDLARLRMTGHAYLQVDRPEATPQWFVSELHPDTFSPAFQDVVTRVLGASTDPLDADARTRLDRLRRHRAVGLADAIAVVEVLRRCFGRQHPLPTDRDLDLLAAESAEMAWIATEGTTCNHCTDRVPDVDAVARRERAAGRPIKDTVEVSASGRVRQTAHRAAPVVRTLPTVEGDVVERTVPGSFFEVISRDRLADGALDLAFDAANATGIFAMTRAAEAVEPGPADG